MSPVKSPVGTGYYDKPAYLSDLDDVFLLLGGARGDHTVALERVPEVVRPFHVLRGM